MRAIFVLPLCLKRSAVYFLFLFIILASPAYAGVDLITNNSDSPDPVAAGGIVTYTISIDNNGDTASPVSTLTVTIPATATYLSDNSVDGVTCSGLVGNELTCDFGLMAIGQEKTVEVELQTQNQGVITVGAEAVTSGAGADDTPGNNIDDEDTTVNQGANVALEKTASAASVPSGSALSYNFTVTNTGPDSASWLRISDPIPSGFTLNSLPAGCSNNAGTIICDIAGSIASGGSTTVGPIIGVVTSASVSTLTNAASVAIRAGAPAGIPQDPDTSNNTDTVDTTVTAGSDVKITKSRSIGGSLLVGDTFNFILSPSYSGDSPQNLTVTDTVPANYTIDAGAFQTSQNGWSCSLGGQDVSCTRASGGASAGYNQAIGDIIIPVTVASSGNAVVNSATISTTSTDPDPGNNTATDGGANLLDPTVDLGINKTGPNPALVVVGVPFNFNVNVNNTGTTGFFGTARVIDTIPNNMTVTGYDLHGWTCTPSPDVVGVPGGTEITCERVYTSASPLAAGATSPSIVMTAETATAGTFTNDATIETPNCNLGTCNDGDLDSYTVTSSVGTDSADIRLIKAVTGPDPVPAGDILTYTLEVINDGPATSNEVRLTDTFTELINNTVGATGAGYIDEVLVAGLATGGSCSNSSAGSSARQLTCNFTTIPVCTQGTDCPVVTIRIRPGGDGGARSNTADAVSNGTADPDHTNDSDDATSVVDPRADVTPTKTVTPNTVPSGQDLTYVVTTRNNGPSRAADVVMTDTLPLDVTFISATPSFGTCGTIPGVNITTTGGNRTVSCNHDSINNGAQQTVTIVIRPNNATRGTMIANDVSVVTSTIETDGPANTVNPNNTATVNADVSNPSLDLVINKTDSDDPVAVGDETVYTIRVNNSGPSAAENVSVTDTLPGTNLSFQSVAGVPCSVTPAVGSFGGTLTCEPGYLLAGSSTSFTVTMRGEVKGFIDNSVSVTSTETAQGFETTEANNSVTEYTTVRTKADMEVVSKVPSVTPVNINQSFDFVITVRNNAGAGLAEADDVEVSDNLPAGLQLTGTPTVNVTTGSATTQLCTGAAGSTSFSCDLGTVSSGGVIEITAPVVATTAPAGAIVPGGGVFTNTAEVVTSSLDINSGNNSKTGDVTVLKSTISGSVFRDLNDNGLQDAGETGISGVSVHLTGTDTYGNPVDVTIPTDVSGNYLFDNLPPSNGAGYTITETQPANFFDGQESAAGVVVVNSKTTDEFSGIVLNSDTALTDYLFGELPPATLSGNIWQDDNNDGVVDGGEPGIGGVDVTLTGTDDQGNAVNITVQTNPDGTYNFTNLRPSDASGYTIAEPTQPAGHFDGLDVAGSLGGTVAADQVTTIIVAAGDNGTGYDFAELLPATLSGSVFIDNDGDAVKDVGETPGVTGLTIQLTGTDDLGAAVSLTETTGANGAYSFTNLRPGTYTVTQITDPTGLTHTGAQAGDNGGTIAGVVRTAGTGVPGEGLLEISAITIGSGDAAANYNFGESGQGLSGFVYVDLNNNGIKDAGEPGIPNVSVTLSGNTDSGTNVCVAINPSPCTVVTDSSGGYAYIDLPASDGNGYTLTEQAQSAPPLSDYQDGSDTAGTLGGTAENDVISGIIVALGEMGANYNFGERGSSISGRVFHDADDNGSFDGSDSGIGGVTITLSGTTSSGADICTVLPSCTFTTAADGTYNIDGLPAGNYTITEIQPVDYVSGTTAVGSAGGTAAGDSISNISLGVGEAATDYLFAEKTGSLTGSVYHDSNNDGVMNVGEAPIAGVIITLSGTTASGVDVCTTLPSCTTTTAADGSYSFTGLQNADATGYTIIETQPASHLDGIEAQGLVNGVPCGLCDNSVDNQISNILFNAASTYTDFDFGEVLGASISGQIWHDIDADGIQDADEPGLGQITLTLTGTDDLGNPVNITVQTAADGTYSFDDLRPSDAAGYTITETQPAGINDFAGSSGTLPGTAGGVAGLNQITGIVLESGVQSTANNFREDASMFASGSVYLDTNNNGVRDPGETGIAGVTITLNASAGGACADGSNSCSVVTDDNGNYLFAGLRAGNYDLIETHPVIYEDGQETAGSQGGTVDNLSFTTDPAQNSITGITLPAGTQATDYLFGELPSVPARISGQVWMNSNQSGGQGSFDAGDELQEGWIVELLQGGTVITSTTTLADGTYEITTVAPGHNYEVRFRNPANGQIWGYPVVNGGVGNVNPDTGTIDSMTIPTGANITGLDLPIDPSGVVYDAISREPVAGAVVTLAGPPGFNPATHLISGSATQTTGDNGFYQFILTPTAPSGTYTLSVVGPAGYTPGTSAVIPPCSNELTVDNVPNPARVQDENTAPAATEPVHDTGSCPTNTSAGGFVTGHTGTLYYTSLNFTTASGDLIQNHIPIDPILGGALTLVKTTPLVNVSIGQLVPYTITATNNLAADLSNIDIRDTLPPGFKYKSGSASLDGVLATPDISGRVLNWTDLSFPANSVHTIKLLLVVGAGVQPGEYVNTAQAFNNLVPFPGNAVSNRATAAVRVIPDPVFDCSDVIGKVFDDQNANGYQDEGEPGIPNVRVATVRGLLITTDAEGRYHVTCAMVPNEFRGSNFIMKLDERTLPSGYRVTTENPRTIHLTRGKMGKLNFGAAIHRVIRLEMTDAAFINGQNEPGDKLSQAISGLLEQLRAAPSVIRLAYNQKDEPEDLIRSRLKVIRKQLETLWGEQGCCYTLVFEEEIFQRHLQNEGGNK